MGSRGEPKEENKGCSSREAKEKLRHWRSNSVQRGEGRGWRSSRQPWEEEKGEVGGALKS